MTHRFANRRVRKPLFFDASFFPTNHEKTILVFLFLFCSSLSPFFVQSLVPGGVGGSVHPKTYDLGLQKPFFLTIHLPGRALGTAFVCLLRNFSGNNIIKIPFLVDCYQKGGVNTLLMLYEKYGPFLPVNKSLEEHCPGLYKFLLCDLFAKARNDSSEYPVTNFPNFVTLLIFTMARHWHLHLEAKIPKGAEGWAGADASRKALCAKRYLLLPGYIKDKEEFKKKVQSPDKFLDLLRTPRAGEGHVRSKLVELFHEVPSLYACKESEVIEKGQEEKAYSGKKKDLWKVSRIVEELLVNGSMEAIDPIGYALEESLNHYRVKDQFESLFAEDASPAAAVAAWISPGSRQNQNKVFREKLGGTGKYPPATDRNFFGKTWNTHVEISDRKDGQLSEDESPQKGKRAGTPKGAKSGGTGGEASSYLSEEKQALVKDERRGKCIAALKPTKQEKGFFDREYQHQKDLFLAKGESEHVERKAKVSAARSLAFVYAEKAARLVAMAESLLVQEKEPEPGDNHIQIFFPDTKKEEKFLFTNLSTGMLEGCGAVIKRDRLGIDGAQGISQKSNEDAETEEKSKSDDEEEEANSKDDDDSDQEDHGNRKEESREDQIKPTATIEDCFTNLVSTLQGDFCPSGMKRTLAEELKRQSDDNLLAKEESVHFSLAQLFPSGDGALMCVIEDPAGGNLELDGVLASDAAASLHQADMENATNGIEPV